MAKRAVRWTKTADLQFVGVLEYWAMRNKSTSYPNKLIKLVTQLTTRISETPLLFKEAHYKKNRVAVMGHFSIFYKVVNDEILITAFWDNRQDPKNLLKLLEDQ
ncbi:type II toxin-antitoxin system RelE/ParE family toxin [bacterium]|nr:type II toxin-antitoxin system RelE/ParE family toxin [bacterium]